MRKHFTLGALVFAALNVAAARGLSGCDATEVADPVDLSADVAKDGAVALIQRNGEVAPAVCPAAGSGASLVANGIDTLTLRIDARDLWNVDQDTVAVQILSADGLIAVLPSAGGGGEAGSTSDGGVVESLSATFPVADVTLRAGLQTGMARISLVSPKFTRDVCIALGANPVSAVGLSVAATDAGTLGETFAMTASLVTTDGTPPSIGTSLPWTVTNSAGLGATRTALAQGSSTVNTVYLPSGLNAAAVTATLARSEDGGPDAGPTPAALCVSRTGVSSVLEDGGCPTFESIAVDAGGDGG